jgi:hypothetical protein
MATIKPRQFQFYSGLNTSRLEDAPEFPSYREFANARVDRGAAKRRDGMVRLLRYTDHTTILSFDNTDDTVTPPDDNRIQTLGLQWTLEVLFRTSSIAADRVIIGGTGASDPFVIITHKTTGVVEVVVTDSAGTATTLSVASIAIDTVVSLQLKRVGAALTLNVNGTTDTDTMSATLDMSTQPWAIGADNGAGFYAGKIEFVRLFRVAKSHRIDAYCRLLNPRASSVIADWVLVEDGNGRIVDRGPFNLHALTAGTPATNGTSISVNHQPILAIGANRNNNTERRAYINVAGRFHPVTF